MKVRRKKGYFSISAVAKMFSVHQQTVRLYEKQGLITPKRSTGNTRLFSEEDIDRLEEVIYLTHEMGINLAGVEMILRLKKQIKKMQSEMNKLFNSTQEELEQESEKSKEAIRMSSQQLLRLKNQPAPHKTTAKTETHNNNDADKKTISVDNWEIEYEE
jgi:MerR family transcriptional regulator/heat shock protein HspR